jgi:hypothetical protein
VSARRWQQQQQRRRQCYQREQAAAVLACDGTSTSKHAAGAGSVTSRGSARHVSHHVHARSAAAWAGAAEHVHVASSRGSSSHSNASRDNWAK